MRIPILPGLILLLRRSPETEFERVMLRRKLYRLRYRFAFGAAAIYEGASPNVMGVLNYADAIVALTRDAERR